MYTENVAKSNTALIYNFVHLSYFQNCLWHQNTLKHIMTWAYSTMAIVWYEIKANRNSWNIERMSKTHNATTWQLHNRRGSLAQRQEHGPGRVSSAHWPLKDKGRLRCPLSVGHCPFDVRQLPIAGASKRQMQHHDTTAATATATSTGATRRASCSCNMNTL